MEAVIYNTLLDGADYIVRGFVKQGFVESDLRYGYKVTLQLTGDHEVTKHDVWTGRNKADAFSCMYEALESVFTAVEHPQYPPYNPSKEV